MDTLYKRELKMEDEKLLRDSCFTFLEASLNGLMPIAVFASYTALGNSLSLSKMAITTIMLTNLRHKLEHSRSL